MAATPLKAVRALDGEPVVSAPEFDYRPPPHPQTVVEQLDLDRSALLRLLVRCCGERGGCAREWVHVLLTETLIDRSSLT
jgi:hypothetical protein